ncbi:MAG: response regulator [Nitrososphaerales archaeon]
MSQPQPRALRIMFVDDEADITQLFKRGLERKGFTVEAFNDPTTALSEFKPKFYDLVVSDIKMPKMNGLELAFEIKKLDPDQRIVFLTAFMDLYTEFKKLFQRMDVLDVIQKPVGIHELADRIAELEKKSQK